MRKVHQDSDGTCGAPTITAELSDEGGPAVNHKRVARIMRSIGLEGVRLRRRHRTTVVDQAAAKAPDMKRLGRRSPVEPSPVTVTAEGGVLADRVRSLFQHRARTPRRMGRGTQGKRRVRPLSR
ncbi:transposase [Streptomyces albipurpureus]|uniref:transposase n=1 Tax=Streptomyces albipurpureus TaxID=2897419 RepID=UPI003CE4B48A